VVDVGADDYESFADLFEESFGHRMSRDEWTWKYAPGRGRGVFALADGRPVAHYGGLTREVEFFGTRVRALQPVDVLVSPKERGVLTRRGAMFRAATALFDAQVGPDKPHFIGMGFPTARHLLLAERLGLFVSAGKMCEIVWPLSARRPGWSISLTALPSFETGRFRSIAEAAWQAMARDLSDAIVAVRDAAWLERRYIKHPTRRYHLVAVRSRLTRKVFGLIVLRKDGASVELLDLVGPLTSAEILIDAARWLAARMGGEMLCLWAAESFAQRVSVAGALCTVTDVHNLALTYAAGPPADRVKERWWLSAGDTDYR
jgi:hypothetical protein